MLFLSFFSLFIWPVLVFNRQKHQRMRNERNISSSKHNKRLKKKIYSYSLRIDLNVHLNDFETFVTLEIPTQLRGEWSLTINHFDYFFLFYSNSSFVWQQNPFILKNMLSNRHHVTRTHPETLQSDLLFLYISGCLSFYFSWTRKWEEICQQCVS